MRCYISHHDDLGYEGCHDLRAASIRYMEHDYGGRGKAYMSLVHDDSWQSGDQCRDDISYYVWHIGGSAGKLSI